MPRRPIPTPRSKLRFRINPLRLQAQLDQSADRRSQGRLVALLCGPSSPVREGGAAARPDLKWPEREVSNANWPEVDGDLKQALEDLKAHDLAIADFHKAHGDNADSRDDHQEIEELRDACLATLIDTAASSMVGILAKAAALQQDQLLGDYDLHQQVALSLATDLIRLGPKKAVAA